MVRQRVSVCIPTYNGEKYIRRQLETILQQLEAEDEVIISDDSSSDATVEIIKSFSDSRIKLLEGNVFHSAIYNLENALKHSSGEYIFLADQDDVWLEDKVNVLLELLSSYDLVISDSIVVDDKEKTLLLSLFSLLGSGKGFWKNLFKNTYVGCCMAFRRSVLNYALPFPEKLPMHDVWIGMCAERNKLRILFYKKPLILYRRHHDNSSSSTEGSHQTMIKKIFDRWILLSSILSRF